MCAQSHSLNGENRALGGLTFPNQLRKHSICTRYCLAAHALLKGDFDSHLPFDNPAMKRLLYTAGNKGYEYPNIVISDAA
jgi:hypothetical protein